MTKTHVRRQTISADGFEALVGVVEETLQALRDKGNKIIGVMFAPSTRERATIFYEFEA
jgi:hypothetical protein